MDFASACFIVDVSDTLGFLQDQPREGPITSKRVVQMQNYRTINQ